MPVIAIDELDPGIRKHVKALRAAGFCTTDSGDGVSKKGTPGEACMLPFPNVACVLDDDADLRAEARRALDVLNSIEEGWQVEAAYVVGDGGSVSTLLCTLLGDDPWEHVE